MTLDTIQARIDTAARGAGRDPATVHLIAVSKVQPLGRVEAVLTQGHRIFGENKVQEAEGKWPDLQARFPGVALHLVGPLQSNKTKPAAALFDAIHSVDREKIARRLATHAQELGRAPEIFLQVNTGEEPQKAGALPSEIDALTAACRAMDLPVQGLMCLPPAEEEAALHFALLAKLAERNGLTGLSMGMSGDFETAIALGATHVRVGSAIFGARVPTPEG
ncbi:MAG: YggS family pyridoxal phosphate-dependent enzyme [Pseudomonadota bacterium]